MIEATFQLVPGVGPHRERVLWASGVRHWDDFPAAPALALSAKLDARMREAILLAREALRRGDAEALAAMLPSRERWRLYPAFEEETAFLDIETEGRDLVTAIGLLDRDGPRVYLRGRDLELFPERARRAKLLVTFNGLAFDVPILSRTFPDFRGPRAHVDLRPLWGRLGHQGGLKELERANGLTRPDHLATLRGLDALVLWRRHCAGERGALRLLAEYNLYDAVNLKSLMALGYNRMLQRYGLPGSPVRPFHRGEVLYDLSKELMALGPP
ncbi:MAG TPA: ribonuclease H-like domain-containing protein [Anaeromyxobacteraceae bacterium]|nr:ribonuclease H-like domain-containing protein [Anaeromyxobacteraceae bacterium]